MNDTDITDIDDSIEKGIPDVEPSRPDLSLINNLSTSEKYMDSEKKLQLQSFHETYPSVIKKSVKNSFLDPSFLTHLSKVNESLLLSDTPLKIETTLKNQKRILF